MIISPAFAAETASAAHHGSLFQDPTFWVGLAFCLTVALLVKLAGKSISAALQARADTIARKLNDASQLRTDAQKMLDDYREKHQNTEQEIESALKRARADAEHLKKNIQADFDAKLKNKESAAEMRLKRATDEASEEIRDSAVSLSLKTAEKILREKLSDEAGKAFLNNAIDTLPQALSKKDL